MDSKNSKSFSPISKYQSEGIYLAIPLSVYVIVWFLHIGDRKPWLADLRVEFYIALLLIIMGFVLRPKEGHNIVKHRLIKITALFLFFIIIQVPFSHNFDLSYKVFVDRVIKFFFMGIFICMFVRNPYQLRLLIAAFLFACFYELTDTYRGYLTGSMVWENQGIMRLHGHTSLTSHPNSLAGFAIGVFPFVWYIFPLIPWKGIIHRALKIVLILLLVVSSLCLLYSGSRTGYVAVFFFLLTISFRSKHSIRLFLSFILIATALASWVPNQYKERFSTIFKDDEGRGGSAIKRIEIMRDSIIVLKKYPLGVGVSAFPTVRMNMFGRTQDTHNLYLEVATNLGVQGLLIFIIFILKILKTLVDLDRDLELQRNKIIKMPSYNPFVNIRHLKDILFMQSICKSIFAYIIIRLALGLFGMDLYEIYWWFSLGITIAISNINIITNKITEELCNECHHRSENQPKSSSKNQPKRSKGAPMRLVLFNKTH